MMPDEYQPTQPSAAPTTERPEKPGTPQAHTSASDGAVPSDSGVPEMTVDTDQTHTGVQDQPRPTASEETLHSPECDAEAPGSETSPSSNDHEPQPPIAAPEASSDIEETARQRDEYKEQLQRLAAEYSNYRRRTIQNHSELSDRGKRDLLDTLLPVVDAMDQALKADADDGVAYRRGVEGIHKQLLKVMRKQGVEPIEAIGADFDPELHQAISHEPSETHRNNEVIEELRRGYKLGDGLLRASLVKVAKA
jgi:molecular chaperone GrpE